MTKNREVVMFSLIITLYTIVVIVIMDVVNINNIIHEVDTSNNILCVDEFEPYKYNSTIQRTYIDKSTNDKYIFTYYYNDNNILTDTEILLIKPDGTHELIKNKEDNYK